jgi:hypothetical protein
MKELDSPEPQTKELLEFSLNYALQKIPGSMKLGQQVRLPGS